MTSKKPYFPNNWKKFKDAPDDVFKPLSYQEMHDWRICSWDIPESVCCIIRVSKIDTGKVEEHIYKSSRAATKKLDQLITDHNNEITIADHDEIHLIRSVIGDSDPFGADFNGDDEC